MQTPLSFSLIVIALSTAAFGVNAAEPTNDNPFYAGAALGGASFSVSSAKAPTPWGREKGDKVGAAVKLYGGYRLTRNFGVEAGYARLGRVSQWTTGNGTAFLQSGTGQAFYAAATARLPLGDSFALNGRLGVARGKISGQDSLLPVGSRIGGNATGVMAGFGAEYSINKNIAVTADYDYFGRLSKNAKGGILTVGLRASF